MKFKFIISLLLLLMPAMLFAGKKDTKGQMPLDPKVKVGKLFNGLTYYIRYNNEPEGRAYFYIAQKVGAIQEKPEQRGLAHFLEHMCFNGTTHFPGDGLRQCLERFGVKFGADLNAYTAVDETVYNIDNVPVNKEGAIDSCLLILHDWSNDLTLAPEEIDKERGVIEEEWRSRNTANQRMNERILPAILPGTKYEDCMPIGSMDIVKTFPHQALRDYYETWYRPDLQAIIVVGDVNVKEVEKKIKTIFKDIPKPSKDAPVREYYPVPDNTEPLVFVGTDKEYSGIFAQVFFKNDAPSREERNTLEYLRTTVMDGFIKTMFHNRTVEYVQKGNAPFELCAGGNGDFFLAKTKYAFRPYVSCHNNNKGLEEGMTAMLREVQRIRQHGFTATEVKRQISDMQVSMDNIYKSRDKRNSPRYVNEYVRHFLDNTSASGVEYEYPVVTEMLSKMTADDINQRFNSYFTDPNNIAIAISMNQNDTLRVPTKEEVLALYHKAMDVVTEPYVDDVSDLPLLPVEPNPGKIVKEYMDEADGMYKFELSNGAKVEVMKTDYKKDQIMLTACARGGQSLLTPEMHKVSAFLNYQSDIAGLGNWTLLQKQKALAGINASASTALSDNYAAVTGSCSPEFIGSMMEQVHAAFLYPHKDSEAFGALQKRLAANYEKSKDKPNSVWGDTLTHYMYLDDPYVAHMESEDIRNIDYDKLLETLRSLYSDASSFTFFFIGNVDIDSLRPYLEKYVASLPSTYSNLKERCVGDIKPGRRICEFEKEQETPTAKISIALTADTEYTLKNYLTAQILGSLLTIKYTKTIREDAGAAYSVSAGAQQHLWPRKYARCVVNFPTSPELKDKAVELVYQGMREMATQGPDEDSMNKVKENLIKVDESNRGVNAYWNYVLINKWFTGIDLSKNYVETVNDITAADIRNMMQTLLDSGNEVRVVMSTPKKEQVNK